MKWGLGRKIRVVLALVTVVLTVWGAFGLGSMPEVVSAAEESCFSAERVANDLAVIAQEPHSVEHPEARERVRSYLVDRLSELGGNPQLYAYDSVAFRLGGYYDIANVYAVFEPEQVPASSYVLFVAHLDSRYRQQVLDRTVYSYGAADDGYGLGTTLELVRVALQYRSDWKQGIKVLFTDSEENGMDGMRRATELHPELFDKVGFVVNLEARGVKGPALLFETGSGDSNVMDLYAEKAKYPVTYSLTTVVYKMMPNFTDFTLVKDSLPGVNFSCLDNISYYHTDLDCFANIDLQTIQHYGVQLEPMVCRYLTESAYASPEALKSEENAVYFTLPWVGLVKLTQTENQWFALVALFLCGLAFVLHTKTHIVRPKQVLLKSLCLLAWGLGVLLLGEGIAWLAAVCAGTPFNLTATKFIPGDTWIGLMAVLAVVVAVVGVFWRRMGKRPFFANETLMAVMLLMTVLGAAMTFALGENFFFLVPAVLSSMALILCLFILCNYLSIVAVALVLLLGCSFLYNLFTALTIGALGVVLMLAFFYVVVVLGLLENFIRVKVVND